ncbi:MAG: hypothetical protein HC941_26205 [Microcoleus sp. SU_5_3]|nr:hypothetical protein [Microcoleus sp. SU_5_3]
MKQTSNKLELQETFAFKMQLFVGGSFVLSGIFFGSLVNLCTLIGLLVMIFAQIETITFDKNLGSLTFKYQQPFIRKTKVINTCCKIFQVWKYKSQRIAKVLNIASASCCFQEKGAFL